MQRLSSENREKMPSGQGDFWEPLHIYGRITGQEGDSYDA